MERHRNKLTEERKNKESLKMEAEQENRESKSAHVSEKKQK